MDFLKRFASTETAELVELRKENREMRKLLATALKVSQELSLKQQESLDRVIMSKFDPPVVALNHIEQPPSRRIPMEHMIDVLSIEDDREFLERTSN